MTGEERRGEERKKGYTRICIIFETFITKIVLHESFFTVQFSSQISNDSIILTLNDIKIKSNNTNQPILTHVKFHPQITRPFQYFISLLIREGGGRREREEKERNIKTNASPLLSSLPCLNPQVLIQVA